MSLAMWNNYRQKWTNTYYNR